MICLLVKIFVDRVLMDTTSELTDFYVGFVKLPIAYMSYMSAQAPELQRGKDISRYVRCHVHCGRRGMCLAGTGLDTVQILCRYCVDIVDMAQIRDTEHTSQTATICMPVIDSGWWQPQHPTNVFDSI